MGSIWLNGSTPGYPNVVDVLRAGGVNVVEYAGWPTRSRSSGGMSQFMAVLCHHTASNTSPANDLNYMVNGSPDNPVSNGLLDRTGTFTIIAGGASNHGGKGGGSDSRPPWNTSKGTIPTDSINSNSFGIEAANNGVGEPWPQAQQDAYMKMCQALCGAYGLVPATDLLSHWEWTSRKCDPTGASRWAPPNTLGCSGAPRWDMSLFRNEAAQLPGPIPPPGEDDMPRLSNPFIQSTGADGSPPGCVFLTDGQLMTFRYIQTPDDLDDIAYMLRVAGLSDAIQPVDNMDAFGMLDGVAPGGWTGPVANKAGTAPAVDASKRG
jgi:hypothetical protein